jgi:hypothetical protein
MAKVLSHFATAAQQFSVVSSRRLKTYAQISFTLVAKLRKILSAFFQSLTTELSSELGQ